MDFFEKYRGKFLTVTGKSDHLVNHCKKIFILFVLRRTSNQQIAYPENNK